MEHQILTLQEEVRGLIEREKAHVTYQHFYWVIGILVSIQISLTGVLYHNQQITDDKVSITKEAVVKMQGKLDPYKVEFKD
jgi:hypothetical protein